MKRIGVFAVGGMLVALGACSQSGSPEEELEATDAISARSVLARSQDEPCTIATDATHVYWTNCGAQGRSVKRLSKATGAEETLATLDDARSIALDDQYVYLATFQTGTVYRVRKDRTNQAPSQIASIQSLAGPSAKIRSLAVDGTHAYFAGDQGVYRVAKAGGAASLFAAAASQVAGGAEAAAMVRVDDTRVYWSESFGGMFARDKTGGATTQLAPQGPWDVAMDSTSIYWIDADGNAQKVAKTGGAVQQLGATRTIGVGGLAAFGGYLYWSDVQDDEVRKIRLSGGTAETHVRRENAGPLAADASGLYWANEGRRGFAWVAPRERIANTGSISRAAL